MILFSGFHFSRLHLPIIRSFTLSIRTQSVLLKLTIDIYRVLIMGQTLSALQISSHFILTILMLQIRILRPREVK